MISRFCALSPPGDGVPGSGVRPVTLARADGSGALHARAKIAAKNLRARGLRIITVCGSPPATGGRPASDAGASRCAGERTGNARLASASSHAEPRSGSTGSAGTETRRAPSGTAQGSVRANSRQGGLACPACGLRIWRHNAQCAQARHAGRAIRDKAASAECARCRSQKAAASH